MLVEAEADINQADHDGVSPLYMSAQEGHGGIVNMLLEAKADVNQATKDGTSPLYISEEFGLESIMDALVEAKADVNQADEDGTSPLFAAAHAGCAGVVQKLVEAGADVNQAKDNGHDPLRASQEMLEEGAEGHESIVEARLAAKADVNRKPKKGSGKAAAGGKKAHTLTTEYRGKLKLKKLKR